MSSVGGYELLTEAFFRDPYPTLRRMQRDDPVYFWEPMKAWMLTRYDPIDALFRDPRFSSQRSRELLSGLAAAAGHEEVEKMISQWSRMIFFLDPPRHTRVRTVANRGFTPASVDALRPGVAATARSLLAAHRERGTIDVATQFAELLSLGTMSELFGIPEADRVRFRQWTTDLLKPAGANVASEEVSRRVVHSSKELFGYMEALVQERQRSPGHDMVSRLIAGYAQDSELAGEVATQCVQIIAAGFLTAARQITNAVLCLLKHPSELRRLRENPGLLKSAVEEAMRYEPAALTMNRLCVEDAEIGGKTIKKGEFVFGFLAAANRDPEVFPDPDRFDISRKPGRHMTFGSGVHYCMGSAITRVELEESLRALLELSDWELGAEPYTYSSFNLQDRGPDTLPMRFRATRGAERRGGSHPPQVAQAT